MVNWKKVNLKKITYPIRIGRVQVALNNNGTNLLLKCSYNGKPYSRGRSLKPDNLWDINFAVAKAQQIDADIKLGCLDVTFVKYGLPSKKDQVRTEEVNLLTIWERYKKDNKARVQKTTQLNYWKLADNAISLLSPDLLDLANASQAIDKMLEKYSLGTIDRVCSSLIAACNYAIGEGLIEKQPFSRLRKKRFPKRGRNDPKTFSHEEITTIVKAFEEQAPDYATMIEFLAATGCRPEEAYGLNWEDIDLSRQTITIKRAYCRGILKGTKTNRQRYFPINQQLADLIKRIPNRNWEIVFPSVHGDKRIDHNNFQRRFWLPIVRGLKEKGVRYLSMYHLRHSFISFLIQQGLDISSVAAISGNSERIIIDYYLTTPKVSNLPHYPI